MVLRDFTNWTTYLDVGLSIAVILFIAIATLYFVRRKAVSIFYLLAVPLFIVSTIFEELTVLRFSLGIAFTVTTILVIFANLSEIRPYIVNPVGKKKKLLGFGHTSKPQVEKIYDRESTYKEIDEAVKYLARNKIGAIITFQRKVDLSEIIKTGTRLNAPVNTELLETIFYPGTRLHDGAVIVKGPNIIAASVYFTPSTRPLKGKYGSRHRAAIGISEQSDAVTVVVSEETGRISIAFNGELSPTTADNFLRDLSEYMEVELEKENG